MQRLLKTADLFSRPFAFSIGEKNKKKQTAFGGILSISVIIVSLLYLIYLLYMYFNNEFLPKLTKATFQTINANSAKITESLVKFQMFIDGDTLTNYEAAQNKKYLTFSLIQEYFSPQGGSQTTLPVKSCTDSGFEQYFCMDIEQMTEKQRTIEYDPLSLVQSSFSILIVKCTGSTDCAPESEIDDLINQTTNYFALFTNIQQFNTTTKSLQSNYILDYYSLDHLLFLESVYSLKKSTTKVKSGLLIQSTSDLEHVIDYSKFDRYHTYATTVTTFGYSGYAYISYKIDQNYQENNIQYPMVTEVLTQFTSIFNILLVVGILANMVADSDIISDLNNLLLKEYFKITALQLIESSSTKSTANTSFTNRKHELSLYLSDRIIHLKNLITNVDFFQKPQAYFNVSLINRLKIIFFGVEKKQEEDQSKQLDIYKEMTKLTTKQIDILEVYKDLIRMKMAIKLMLSEEQFAALQFCGREVQSEKLNESNDISRNPNQITKDWQVSHRKPYQLSQQELGDKQKINLSHSIQQSSEILSPKTIEIKSKMRINVFNTIQPPQNGDTTPPKGTPRRQKLKTFKTPIRPVDKNYLKPENTLKVEHHRNSFSSNSNSNNYSNNNHQLSIASMATAEPKLNVNQMSNHLESVDEIEQNESFMRDLLDRFINRIESQEYNVSVIDRNIYSSLIGKNKPRFNYNNL